MLVVCGLQPAAAAEAEDEGIEEKTNKSNLKKKTVKCLWLLD
jgi:hypothetical protein